MLTRAIRQPSVLHRRLLNISAIKKSTESTSSSKGNAKTPPADNSIDYSHLKFPSKIPPKPIASLSKPNKTTISVDPKTLQLLERLSLVDLDTKEALQNLEASIEFAERVVSISTIDVEPMYTVLEDYPLTTRPDQVTDGNIKDDILSNSSVTEEDYFVAPPGNIPLEQKDKKFD